MTNSQKTFLFEKIVISHKSHLDAIAYNFKRNRQDAEDLCQETLLHAWGQFSQYDLASKPMPWLYTIMKHVFLNMNKREHFLNTVPYDSIQSLDFSSGKMGRKHNKKNIANMTYDVFSSPDALLNLYRQDLNKVLKNILGKLSEKEKKIVQLCHVEEKTSKEVGKVLKMSDGAIRSRLVRINTKLRDYLQNGSNG